MPFGIPIRGQFPSMMLKWASADLPAEHWRGVRGLSTQPPTGHKTWTEYEAQFLKKLKVSPNLNHGVPGMYDYMDNTIHFNPRYKLSKDVFAHELGHHVTTFSGTKWGPKTPLGLMMRDKERIMGPAMVDKLRNRYGWQDASRARNGMELYGLGLRPYSLTKPLELQADVYACWAYGTPRQKTNLARTLGLHTDLDGLFGPRRNN
jgi:hypothetical protein